MAEATPIQSPMYNEELDFKSAVSEATMTKIGGNINGIIAGNGEPLGTVITSILTVSQFHAIRSSSKWVRMEGQSIAGSDLETLAGLSTLPDMVTTGSFPRQTDSDSNIGNTQTNQNKSHRHTELESAIIDTPGTTLDVANPILDRTQDVADTITWQVRDEYRTGLEGGTEARPEAIKLNYFIKINS